MTKEEIKKIVIEQEERSNAELKELEEIRKQYPENWDEPFYSPYNEKRDKILEEHTKKWHPDLDSEEHKQTPFYRLFEIEQMVPISKEKQCCATCGCLLCSLRRKIKKEKEYVCSDYVLPTRDIFGEGDILYFKAVYNAKEPTFEEKINNGVEYTWDKYQKCLKVKEKLEKQIKKPIKQIDAKLVEQDKKEREEIHNNYKRLNECYDYIQHPADPNNEFSLAYTEIVPNKEKFKKLMEETGKCPGEILAESMWGRK